MSSDMAVDKYSDSCRVVLGGLLLGISTVAPAENAEKNTDGGTIAPAAITLTVSPLTCVALHKNQVCYKSLDVRWSSLAKGRYCLHASDHVQALQCWNHNALDNLRVNYASATEIVYELRAEGGEEPLASIVVKTSWVYRTGRRSASGWRLF